MFHECGDMRPRVYRGLRNGGPTCPIPHTRNFAAMLNGSCRCGRHGSYRNLVSASVASSPAVFADYPRYRRSMYAFYASALSPARRRAIAKRCGGRAFFVRDAGEIVATRRLVRRPRDRKSTVHRI